MPAVPRRLWLAAILLAGAAIRVYRLSWGLPAFVFNDTRIHFTNAAAQAAANGDWILDRFVHPPLYPYLISAITWVWTTLSGTEVQLRGPQGVADLAAITLGARYVTVALAVALIGLVYLVGQRLLGSRAGLWAAAFFAMSPVHVIESHRVNVDTPMLVLAMASAWFAIRAHQERRIRDLWISFALAAAAGATKYTGLFAGTLPIWVALRWPTSIAGRVRGIATGGAISLVTILLLMSPVALNWSQFVIDLAPLFFIGMFRGAPGQDLQGTSWVFAPYLYLLFVGLPFVLGWPVYLAGLLGIAVLAARDRPALALIAAAILPFFLLQGAAETATPRYYLPFAPYLAIAAGAGVVGARLYSPRLAVAFGAAILCYTTALAVSQVQRIGGAPQAAVGETLANLSHAKQHLGISLRSRRQPKLVIGYPNWSYLQYDSIRPYLRNGPDREHRFFPRELRNPGDAINPREALREDRSWVRANGIDVVVVPSRWENLRPRHSFMPREEQFFEALVGERLGFRQVTHDETTYFTQSWYEWADPALDTIWTAGISGYKLFVRDDLLPAVGR